MSVYSKGSRPPPGLLPPASPGQISQAGSGVSRATHSSLQGTSIDHKGVCSVNLVVDDLEIPFMAVRDSVRFLNSMYPDWSMPAFVGGVSLPNEVGATYSIEHYEKTAIDAYDGADQEVQVKRKKLITIKDIMNQARFKVITFDVVSRIESDIITEPFDPTSYIVVEIKAFPYEQGKFQFTVTFDGGPPDVEVSYSCICIVNPASLKRQEDAQELRPRIYAQASSLMNYIKNFNPNTPVARQVYATNAQNQQVMDSRAQNNSRFGSKGGNSAAMYSYDDDLNSQSGSKVSKNSKGSRGFEYQSPAMAHVQQVMRSDSSNHYQSGWSTGTPPQSPSSADEIRKLYDLLNIGAITKQEFDVEKRKLLNKAADY